MMFGLRVCLVVLVGLKYTVPAVGVREVDGSEVVGYLYKHMKCAYSTVIQTLAF